MSTSKRHLGRISLNLLFCSIIFGCEIPDSEDEDDNNSLGGVIEASCEDWKTAYCNQQERCGTTPRSECAAFVSPIDCDDAAPLDRCVVELKKSCDLTPNSCDAQDIADTTIAMSQCFNYISSYCETFVSCNPSSSYAQCESYVNLTIDCTQAFAVSNDFEGCIEILDSGACSSTLPPECEGTVFLQ